MGETVDELDDAQLLAAINASLETRNRVTTLKHPHLQAAVAHLISDSELFAIAARTQFR